MLQLLQVTALLDRLGRPDHFNLQTFKQVIKERLTVLMDHTHIHLHVKSMLLVIDLALWLDLLPVDRKLSLSGLKEMRHGAHGWLFEGFEPF